MTGVSETHEKRKEQARQAGYDFGLGVRDESNCDSKHFEHPDLSDQWERGARLGENVRRLVRHLYKRNHGGA